MNTPLPTTRRNPWPYAIIAWFIIFGGAMAAWVVVAVRQDPDLVRSDYYEQEITYQQQIDRLNRTSALRGELSLAYNAARHQVSFQLPAAHRLELVKGTIHFYRPSDAKLDFDVPLSVDANGNQRVNTEKLRDGLWKVRVQWSAGEDEYFFDQSVVLAGS